MDNFYVLRALFRPAKTYPVLIVHANTLLSNPADLQHLKADSPAVREGHPVYEPHPAASA
jgi:hypothetical protein